MGIIVPTGTRLLPPLLYGERILQPWPTDGTRNMAEKATSVDGVPRAYPPDAFAHEGKNWVPWPLIAKYFYRFGWTIRATRCIAVVSIGYDTHFDTAEEPSTLIRLAECSQCKELSLDSELAALDPERLA